MVGIEKDVTGLNVTMQKIVFESQVESAGYFITDIQHFELGKALLFFNACIEAAAVGQFHHQVALAFKFVEGINVNDVGVIQGSDGSGFPIETFKSLGVCLQLL